MTRVARWASVVVIALAASGCGGDKEDQVNTYYDRELLLPGADYRLHSPEKELLQHEWEPFVNPEKPLSQSLMEEVVADPREAVRRELTERVEKSIEELLFD